MMNLEFVGRLGDVVPADQLANPQALALAQFLASGKHPFAQLLECRAGELSTPSNVVVFEAAIERPQDLVHDIRAVEPIAAILSTADETYPEVLALRPDFPKVPHLNLRPSGVPPSLCLYEEPWAEIRLTWTPAAFVERLRAWLARTADGTLHDGEQALEPLLGGSGYHLVLPADLISTNDPVAAPERLSVTMAAAKEPRVLIARRQDDRADNDGLQFAATLLRCAPQPHGIIHHAPRSLAELQDFASAAGLDLLGHLRSRLLDWLPAPAVIGARLIIIIVFPKMRAEGKAVEAQDIWAFLTSATVAEIGQAIGCYAAGESDLGGKDKVFPLIVIDGKQRGESVTLDVIHPQFAFDRERATTLSGYKKLDDRRVAAIGAGALGSHLVMHLAREGYGRWTLIDNDYLLPHNLARHALSGFAVGCAKAEALAYDIGALFGDETAVEALHVDVLAPGGQVEPLCASLAEADLILDMSASIPVARHLAIDVESRARRISLFFNPAGTDLVLLSEDAERRCTLDDLEMQYYRTVATTGHLADHLEREAGRFRYGRSCRDLTSAIPQNRIALLSGIAAAAIRRAADAKQATITIWRTGAQRLDVTAVPISINGAECRRLNDWTLRTDHGVLRKLRIQRENRLPNETGGVLIGAFDLQRRIVYVVDTIPSPPDSLEYPALYIRGAEGLRDAIHGIERRTLSNLRYVGEWHSHPDGCGSDPSADDERVFAWLAEHMGDEGLPPVMAIASRDEVCFFIDKIDNRQGVIAHGFVGAL